ncbi:MAG: transglutaminase domain-containing protein [Hespellia sp.]|nr:transglutaminase domain-containing protein [Hespellia sp.]
MKHILLLSGLILIFAIRFKDLYLVTAGFLLSETYLIWTRGAGQKKLAYILLIFYLLFWMGSVRSGRCKKEKLAGICLSFMIMIIGCTGVTVIASNSEGVESLRLLALQAEENLCYGKQSPDDEILLHFNGENALYLKNRTYVRYDETGGTELDESEIDQKYKGMNEYFRKENFSPFSQLSQYIALSPSEDSISDAAGKESEMMVEIKNGSRKYFYLPIGASFQSLKNIPMKSECFENAISTEWSGTKEYHLNIVEYDCEEILSMEVNWGLDCLEHPEDYETDAVNFAKCERVYRNFIYDYYTSLPEKVPERLKDVNLDAIGGNTAKEVIDSVRTYLALEEKPMTEEAYAIEALYLLRFAHVPCRVAEGYYYVPSDESGTSEIKLQNKNRHVWLEVYVNGAGFVTAEMNPDYYQENIAQMDADFQNSAPTPAEHTNLTDPAGQKRGERTGILWMLAGILILALAVGLFLWRAVRRCIWKHRLRKATDETFLTLLSTDLEKMLKCSNINVNVSYPERMAEIMSDRYGLEMDNLTGPYFQMLEEVTFYEKKLNEEEKNRIRRLHLTLYSRIKNEKPVWMRVKIWYCRNS